MIFNGKESFACEDGSSEYVREKRAAKDEPQPTPYDTADLDLSKAVQRGRQSCGLTDVAHECVVIDIPIKQWERSEAGGMETGNGGSKRVVLDTFTGLCSVRGRFNTLKGRAEAIRLTPLMC